MTRRMSVDKAALHAKRLSLPAVIKNSDKNPRDYRMQRLFAFKFTLGNFPVSVLGDADYVGSMHLLAWHCVPDRLICCVCTACIVLKTHDPCVINPRYYNDCMHDAHFAHRLHFAHDVTSPDKIPRAS